ncbi:hypothetical protein UF64_11510 [Thalassospira sp. HJ]|uniref:hypothetical protein n=1 Tax=unclassified Thalassospira TaxID=2648997 RepID=UPI0005CE14F4|nr:MULTISPECIES: hypothetical protein [unclassified Thalassospira]KJE35260.1 hypothetical protein UF64_11510 [Thalassospira sp. HJ]MBC08107.1 hypothetical protein [Thalassospira sp.]|tara:strand:- start:4133 stop:5104 length:972 start_codon:yes stop_codon:yes gene_type:complete
MSENLPRRRGQAPGRFVSTRKVREAAKLTRPVRETPIKRFDSKDMMERDLERYRADARARLLKNGFDIPAFLMPKLKKNPDDEDGDENPDPVIEADLRPPAMTGPKPTMSLRNDKLAEAKQERAVAAAKANPRRYVYGQNAGGGLMSMFLPEDGQAAGTSTAASNALQTNRAQDPAAHAAAQKAAIAEERSAYEEYVESLNGGKTLLDVAQGKEGAQDGHGGQNDISGRVDDLKEAEVRTSRINLPDSESDWAIREDLDAKRRAHLQKQGKSGGKSAKARKEAGEPLSWNKMIARLAAYMIAAVAVGYVLVLTFNEFSAILGR